MGINYDFELVAGYRFSRDEFLKYFTKTTPAVTHYEVVINEKTGNQTRREVIDEPEVEKLVFDGVGYEYEDELFDAMSEELGCNFVLHDEESGEEDVILSVLEVESVHEDRVTVSEPVEFNDLVDLQIDIQNLGQRLRELGVTELPEPVVMIAARVG